jgi:hypothetical protein
VVILLAVAFVVTLGVVVGTRMSSDAIAVLVGVIAGVAASIPCALLLLAVTRRQETRAPDPYSTRAPASRQRGAAFESGVYPRQSMPPVIVVTPGSAGPQQIAPWSTAPGPADAANLMGYNSEPPRGQRQFRVMGYEEAEEQDTW